MTHQRWARVIGYTLIVAIAVRIGARQVDVGECCAVLLFFGMALLAESISARRRYAGNRTALAATVIITLTLVVRCAAEAMTWETATLGRETNEQFVGRHASEVRR